jgi:hypothetical protein
MFLSVVDKHIPKYCIKSVHDHPWIDKELSGKLRRNTYKEESLKNFQTQLT